jgi:hypothetical protein
MFSHKVYLLEAMLVEFEMHNNSDCTAFIGLDSTDANKIACEWGCEFRDVGEMR